MPLGLQVQDFPSVAAARQRVELIERLLMLGVPDLPEGTDAYTTWHVRPGQGQQVTLAAIVDRRARVGEGVVKDRAANALGRPLPPVLALLALEFVDFDDEAWAWFRTNSHVVWRFRRTGPETSEFEEGFFEHDLS